jgi:voltage-gated potassium channel
LSNWFFRRRFLVLLAALLALLVIVPADWGTLAARMLAASLLTAVYVAGFVVVLTGPRYQRAGLLLGVPTLAGAWAEAVFPTDRSLLLDIAHHGVAILFLVFVTVVILRSVLRMRAVTTDDVAGALCGYLLVGAAFGHTYSLVEHLTPGSFRFDDISAASTWRPGQLQLHLTYFSFMTLTTVGYGDITPAGGTARGLATVEAVVGQFYIAVLIADLIGKRVALALTEQAADDVSRQPKSERVDDNQHPKT